MSWLAALTVWPAPEGPTSTIVLPTASKTSDTASKSDFSPPTMIDSTPSMAPGSPPETGASSGFRPFSLACSARSVATSGRMVEKSIQVAPAAAEARMPSSPSSTFSTSGESGTMVMMTSAPSTASAMVAAACPPASARASALAGVRLKPRTVKPALTRFLAMGRPMIPSPMNAIVLLIGVLPSLSGTGSQAVWAAGVSQSKAVARSCLYSRAMGPV